MQDVHCRVPTHFQNPFSIPLVNGISSVPPLAIIYPKFYSWNTMQKTSTKLSSAVEQNLNKKMVEFSNFILFQNCMHILAKFNIFLRSWKPISLFNTSSIVSIPHGNPYLYELSLNIYLQSSEKEESVSLFSSGVGNPCLVSCGFHVITRSPTK